MLIRSAFGRAGSPGFHEDSKDLNKVLQSVDALPILY